jgi:hypothetical protein
MILEYVLPAVQTRTLTPFLTEPSNA